MRVALLSLMDAAAEEPSGLRGHLPIGGRSVLRHQVGLALAFGCARIVVQAEALTGELVALQHVAESAGARFHVIPTGRALVPLVSPEDELLVLADGLLAVPEDALRLLNDGPVILTMPVETGLAAGFERIDINHASAGAMRLPGRVVAGLGELPPEWSPASALLRIAVQAGVPQRDIPFAFIDQGRWRLIRSEDEAHRAEPGWLRLHTIGAHRRSPGEMLAGIAVQKIGPALLHAGTRPYIVTIASFALGVLGVGAGWFGSATIGFALLALCWLVAECAALLARVERASLLASARMAPTGAAFALLLDAGFVALCAWRSELADISGVAAALRLFAPLVLVLTLRLVPAVCAARDWTSWLSDRFLCGIGLAVLSAIGPFDAALRMVVLALLAGTLFDASAVGRRTANAASTIRE